MARINVPLETSKSMDVAMAMRLLQEAANILRHIGRGDDAESIVQLMERVGDLTFNDVNYHEPETDGTDPDTKKE